MYSVWTEHLKNPEHKEQFKNTVLASKPVLERLSELLDKREKDMDQTELSLATYDTPSWSHKQAHNNGYRAALKVVRNLIDLEQQTNTGNKWIHY